MLSPVPQPPAWWPQLAAGQPYLPVPYCLAGSSTRAVAVEAGPQVALLEIQADTRDDAGDLGLAPAPKGLFGLARAVAGLPSLRRIVLGGRSEPLASSELPDIIGMLSARNAYIAVDTDGTRLSSSWQAELVRAGPDELRVSIPAARATSYARLTGSDRFSQVVSGLRGLAEARSRLGSRLPRLVLRCPARAETVDEWPALVRLAAEAGAEEFYLQRVVLPLDLLAPGGEAQRADWTVFGAHPAHLDEVLSECEALSLELGIALRAAGGRDPRNSLVAAATPADHPWQACLRPWLTVSITAAGDCYPCRTMPLAAPRDQAGIMGNVFAQPFAEIWNGPRYQAFRQALLSATPHPACAACGVRWSL